jgi:DNA polymerase I-like protein with 3'-5' exonuclease and polymerase domains
MLHTTNTLDQRRTTMGVEVEFITTQQGALQALMDLQNATDVAFDTETVVLRDANGAMLDLNTHGPGPLRAISIAARFPDGSERCYVIDCAKQQIVSDETAAVFYDGAIPDGDPVDVSALAAAMHPLHVYAWNADFDERVMEREGVLFTMWTDLMLVRALLRLGGAGVRARYALAQAAKRYLGVAIDGKGTVQTSFTESDPLTAEQILYAAKDAKITLDLAGVLMPMAQTAGIMGAVDVGRRARPFRSWMERSGIAFNIEQWRTYLANLQPDVDDVEARLAKLTNGGQATLFDPVERPTWKPSSPDDVKRVLNAYATNAVRSTIGHDLVKEDSVDNVSLERMNHPLARAIIEWRELDKLRSTYGEKFISHVHTDGRIHASYNQEQVGTGRLSSDSPNMQNIAPQSKHCFRSPTAPVRSADGTWQIEPGQRVLVMGDLGQAELRALADVSGDEGLLDAFAQQLDMHVVTAARMFGIDVLGLKQDDLAAAITAGGSFSAHIVPAAAKAAGVDASLDAVVADPQAAAAARQLCTSLYGEMRSRGKTMNFAVIYGLSAKSLADTLTRAGVVTTEKEGRELQAKYFAAFPKVAQFLQAADARVAQEASSLTGIDFNATIRLAKIFPRVLGMRSSLRKQLERFPDEDELFDAVWPRYQVISEYETRHGRRPNGSELDAECERLRSELRWVLGFDAAVVVRTDGTEYVLEARTVSGRRRLFHITAENWLLSVAITAAMSKQPHAAKLRRQFEALKDVSLSRDDGGSLGRVALAKRFENRTMRMAFVEYVLEHTNQAIAENGGSWQGRDAASRLCYMALEKEVSMLTNAVRNAPIQGGVADAVLHAFGELYVALRDIPGAVPVQSVHDSIVIECDAQDALRVGACLRACMLSGMQQYFPSVEAAVDVEIAASLDAKRDIIDEAVFATLA